MDKFTARQKKWERNINYKWTHLSSYIFRAHLFLKIAAILFIYFSFNLFSSRDGRVRFGIVFPTIAKLVSHVPSPPFSTLDVSHKSLGFSPASSTKPTRAHRQTAWSLEAILGDIAPSDAFFSRARVEGCEGRIGWWCSQEPPQCTPCTGGGVLKYAQNIITLKREHHIAITESAMLRSPYLLLFKVLWYMCLLLSFSFGKGRNCIAVNSNIYNCLKLCKFEFQSKTHHAAMGQHEWKHSESSFCKKKKKESKYNLLVYGLNQL